MASTTPANMLVSSILGMSIPAYLVVHAVSPSVVHWILDDLRG
jgi:hypothetical protein